MIFGGGEGLSLAAPFFCIYVYRGWFMRYKLRNDHSKVMDGVYAGRRLIDIALVNPGFILEFNELHPGVASIELIEYCRDEVLVGDLLKPEVELRARLK